jgi:glycosyltransferase involved in cell wall biosynthesis
MGEVIDITVILPVHEINDELKKYYENAIKSITQQKAKATELLVVVPKGNKDVIDYVNSYDYNGLTQRTIINDGKTDFASQVNLGVEQASSKWVTFLEMDDEFSIIWLDNARKYITAYPETEIFLPIVVDVDVNGQYIGFTNETVWASQFSDEMGYLDHDTVLKYQNYNFDGMVIKKDTYLSNGGIKPTIKLTFMYEFLLRMTHFGVITMTIPKLGYKHVNQRPGSLFNNYSKEIKQVEAQWWMSLAKRECHQVKAREITYEDNKD